MHQVALEDEAAGFNREVLAAIGTLFVTWKSEHWKKALWATRTHGIEVILLPLPFQPKSRKSSLSDCGSFVNYTGIMTK